MAKTIIGIMGPGEGATEKDRRLAYELGRLVATKGWVLVTGGRAQGVMHAAAEGAKAAGGLTLGILPSPDRSEISTAIDIPVLTSFGEARNVANVLTSQVVLVCGMSAGTASEVSIALRNWRPVIFVDAEPATVAFFASLGSRLFEAKHPTEAIGIVDRLIQEA